MHEQLRIIVEEFDSAGERLGALVEAVPEDLWPRRPTADRWSIGESVEHLNLTSAAYVAVMREAMDAGGRLGCRQSGRYRRDPLGWLLWRTMGPPVRFRVRTTAAFIPNAIPPVPDLVSEFRRLQVEQVACVHAADGLPLERIRIRSPFNPRTTYNLYSALSLLPRHQHRHLWQAEQVPRLLRAGRR